MHVIPIGNASINLAAEIHELDLSEPLRRSALDEFLATFAKYPVLVIRGQGLSDDGHLRLGAYFGEIGKYTVLSDHKKRVAAVPGIARMSNVDEQDNIRPASSRKIRFSKANELWHSDLSFHEVPASASILYAHEAVPSGHGGETEFANMYAAYDSLASERQRQLEEMSAWHSTIYSRRRNGFTDFTDEELAAAKPIRWPLVRRHPVSERKCLYLSSHIGRFSGKDEDESEQLIEELMQAATKPEFVYSHSWLPGDVVIWDNQCTMHRARPYDPAHRRVMQRVTALVESVIPAAVG
jgi:alpha-ketoglutarate-dependent 2,4-dichlorophenoxyacetate dioxygenase